MIVINVLITVLVFIDCPFVMLCINFICKNTIRIWGQLFCYVSKVFTEFLYPVLLKLNLHYDSR